MIFREAVEMMKMERLELAANGLKEIRNNCLDLSSPEKNEIDDSIALLKEYKYWLGKEKTDREKDAERSEATREERDLLEENLVNKTFGLKHVCLVDCQLSGSIHLDVRSDSECVLLKLSPDREEPNSFQETVVILTLEELKALRDQINLSISEVVENG